ncbi:MAG: RAD55 family ATPase [Candidatus Nezhaarchaeales archaeon]
MERIEQRRLPSGIPGLDEVLGGGIFEGSFLLVAGLSGTGKTVLVTQMAYNMALRGNNIVYVSFDEGLKLVDFMKSFNWNLEDLVREGKFIILDFTTMKASNISECVDFILMRVKEANAKMLVIDSLTTLIMTLPEFAEARIMVDFLRRAKPANTTLVATANMITGIKRIGVGIEEVVADTVLLLDRKVVKNEYRTFLSVLKMRGSVHSKKRHELIITPSGVSVVTVA